MCYIVVVSYILSLCNMVVNYFFAKSNILLQKLLREDGNETNIKTNTQTPDNKSGIQELVIFVLYVVYVLYNLYNELFILQMIRIQYHSKWTIIYQHYFHISAKRAAFYNINFLFAVFENILI